MSVNKSVLRPTKTAAVIPAAGSGLRMGGVQEKQFLDLKGRPLLAVTLGPFQRCLKVDALFLVVPPGEVGYCQAEIVERFGFDKVKRVVPGGKRRQDSVRLGLEATRGEYGLVLIHDGVRPLVDEALIEEVLKKAKTFRAVICGLPPKDTVKEINDGNEVVKTHERKRLWLVQTPQVFRFQDIFEAHNKSLQEGWEEATDDAVLVERLGIPIKVIEGAEENIKVTTPQDLELARFLLGRNTP
jgi:2-C-methyl-D-erythritol 4-phosphate cytidylyltransferase